MSKQEELEAERFIHHGMQYLRTTFPEKANELDDNALKNKLIDDCQYAMSFGFESEAEIMMIVDILWRLPQDAMDNPNFDWVKEILGSDDLDNETKIDSLHNAFALTSAVQEEEIEGESANDGSEDL